MTAPHATIVIDGYLARLEAELSGAPAALRSELVEDVRRHIAEARAALVTETDADLLNIVDRLGEPSELATEARENEAEAKPQPLRWGWLEVAAIALTVVAWPAGAILVWLSRAWNGREKLLATFIGGVTFVVGFPLFAPLVGPLLGPLLGSLGPGAPVVMGTFALFPLASAVFLAFRLSRTESSLGRIA